MAIDINMDAGEGISNEKELFPFVQAVSIASGGHTGSEASIRQCIEAALAHSIQIGIHPSLPDKTNFGRTWIDLPLEVLLDSLQQQWDFFTTIARSYSIGIHHVKWHGALYNRAAEDMELALRLAELVRSWDSLVFHYAPPDSAQIKAAKRLGLKTKSEAFADRHYLSTGALCPRTIATNSLTSVAAIVERIVDIQLQRPIATVDGASLLLPAETICLHSDHPLAFAVLTEYNNRYGKKS
ncbi:MAG: LamB/YcsF family protein [Cytophagaceae bacterium]|jgi:UPF0271 protein|nr:LamB/YcsF family protein [Cytophagaceae bacterium]